MRTLATAAIMLLLTMMPGPHGAMAAPDLALPAALTSPYPSERYQGWLSSSMPDEDSGVPSIIRVAGDRYSRFYYYVDGDFRTEDGRLLAHVRDDLLTYGVRKTPASLRFFLYRNVAGPIPRYDIVTIAGGRATIHRCMLDLSTFDDLARLPGASTQQIRYRNRVVNALQAAEPALARDHCRAVSNGSTARGVARQRPVLRQPFPHVGDVFIDDNRGFKGGWLYGGLAANRPADGHCCAFHYYGENRDAIILVDYFRKKSNVMRVISIFYVQDFVRYATVCRIDGELAAIAVGDEDWKNGRAYLIQGKLSNGREPRIVRWSGMAPEGCRDYVHEVSPDPA